MDVRRAGWILFGVFAVGCATSPDPSGAPPVSNDAATAREGGGAPEACADARAEGEAGADVDVVASPAACAGRGFAATPIDWSLPSGFSARAFVSDLQPTCAAPTLPAYALVDLTGDRRPDLVVTALCDAGPVGTSQWLVYENEGTRFSATATTWPLPPGFAARAFWTTERSTCSGVGTTKYFLQDMDGDLRADLVVDSTCGDGSSVGSDHWQVYRNRGDGFSSTPIAWSLPSTFGAFAFGARRNDDCAASIAPRYFLLDVDADLRPELVVSFDCRGSASIGTDRWLVFANLGDRFAATAVDWSLPAYGARAFVGDDSDTCSGVVPPMHFVLDMDGDLRPDLVVPSTCDGSSVGVDRWVVHRNVGSGFAATPLDWPLPAGFGDRAFAARTRARCSSAAYPAYDLLDLDGDRRPDLVVTAQCDGSPVGTTQWNAFENRGAGFAPSPIAWCLPPGYESRAFWSTSSDECGTVTSPRFALHDMNGDFRPELVVTFRCDDSPLGTTDWFVY